MLKRWGWVVGWVAHKILVSAQGFESDWPNYDEQNGWILPSNAELLRQGNHIVKKVNGLFIEKRPEDYPAQNQPNSTGPNWPNGPS